MAWYYGTYSCGHDGRTDIGGPTKDRERIAEYRFSGLCPDCWKKQQEEKRSKKNAYAAEKSAEMELPELTGTEKQVAWATTIRLQKVESVFKDADRQIETIKKSSKNIDQKPVGIAMIKNALNWFIDARTSASYWIDERDTFFNFNKILGDYGKTAEGAAMLAVIHGTATAEEIATVAEMATVKAEMRATTETTETVKTAKSNKKRYNKSEIMRRAWELRKATNEKFSICLKKSWAEAKSGLK